MANDNKIMDLHIDNIQKTIGMKSSDLSNEARVNFKDDSLRNFLVNLTGEDNINFLNSIFSFWLYHKNISPVKEVMNTYDLWVNFMLIILFGLIERVMQESNHIDCYTYCKPRQTAKDYDAILEEWRSKYGCNEKIRVFFKNFISASEQKEILDAVKNDPEWKDVDDIAKFISKIINYRSKFIHELSMQSVSPYNEKMSFSNNLELKSWYPTLSIDKLTRFILHGVFRKFDVNKNLPLYV